MTLLRSAVAILASATAFVATSAVAQYTGTRIGRNADENDGPAAIQVIAKCLVDRHPGVAGNWLRTIPGSPEEGEAIKGLTEDLGMCMGNYDQLVLANKAVSFQPKALRQPVANLMARSALTRIKNPSIDPDEEPWFLPMLRSLSADDTVDRQALAIQDFGHCVAIKDWDAAKMFLLAESGTPAEQDAVKRLIPSLGPCLSADVTLKLTPTSLRVVLAEPVYHILAASDAQAAGGKR